MGDARPNPNDGYAEIPYFLPETETTAKIIFTDMLGRVMQEQVLATGYGLIPVDTQDLPSGTYFYSLIINGNKVDIKQMVRAK